MLPLKEEKQRIIEKRILRELTQYGEQQNAALPMQILSAKYSRACLDIGGFPELIASMEASRLITVTYSENGARTVSINTSSRMDAVTPVKPPSEGWF
jgi:hypothetical protein